MNCDALQKPFLIIEAGKNNKHYWSELLASRELFFFLTWRDVLILYKQTAIGILWSFIRPALMMAVFTVVFGRLANLPSPGNAPYALMVLAGLLPWQLFSQAIQNSSESLIRNTAIISKIYFPRLLIPLSTIFATLIDFVIALVFYLLLVLYYQHLPDWRILTMPFFLLLALLTATGIGLITSALNVYYRDFKHIIPFLLQIGLYASPVGFSSAIIPKKWHLVYALNPMASVIEGFRWSLLGENNALSLPGLLTSTTVMLLLLVCGIRLFRKMENTFADKL